MGFEQIIGPNFICPTPPSGDSTNRIADTAFVTAAIAAIPPPPTPPVQIIPYGHLWGLTLSTAGSSATFSVAIGQAVDSTNVDFMTLASSISKTTAAWAVGTGNGAWDGTGTNPTGASIWQHVHLIKRTDTGVVDILISASATSPTLPASYTEFRRIGSMKTNASNQWIAFNQFGNNFYWVTGVNDSTSIPTSTDTVYTLASVPTGVRVIPFVQIGLAGTSNTIGARIRSPDMNSTETAISASNGLATWDVVANGSTITRSAWANMPIITNTSAQVNIIADSLNSGNGFTLRTEGWYDFRGMI
jgi:hypothetical protein